MGSEPVLQEGVPNEDRSATHVPEKISSSKGRMTAIRSASSASLRARRAFQAQTCGAM